MMDKVTTNHAVTEGVMGWVARDKARRLRGKLGIYRWDEWQRCCAALGLRCEFVKDVLERPAVVIDDIILVKDGLDDLEAARWIWHEIGHVALHAGNSEFTHSKPHGQYLIAKAERQADEFAREFPIWD